MSEYFVEFFVGIKSQCSTAFCLKFLSIAKEKLDFNRLHFILFFVFFNYSLCYQQTPVDTEWTIMHHLQNEPGSIEHAKPKHHMFYRHQNPSTESMPNNRHTKLTLHPWKWWISMIIACSRWWNAWILNLCVPWQKFVSDWKSLPNDFSPQNIAKCL